MTANNEQKMVLRKNLSCDPREGHRMAGSGVNYRKILFQSLVPKVLSKNEKAVIGHILLFPWIITPGSITTVVLLFETICSYPFIHSSHFLILGRLGSSIQGLHLGNTEKLNECFRLSGEIRN